MSETSGTNEKIDLMIEGVSFSRVSRTGMTDTRSGQTVIYGCDDERVSDPDEASSGKSYQSKGKFDKKSVKMWRRWEGEFRSADVSPEFYFYAPRFWDTLSFSAGRERSFKPAATRHHFINGAQKNTVFGPEKITSSSWSPVHRS